MDATQKEQLINSLDDYTNRIITFRDKNDWEMVDYFSIKVKGMLKVIEILGLSSELNIEHYEKIIN